MAQWTLKDVTIWLGGGGGGGGGGETSKAFERRVSGRASGLPLTFTLTHAFVVTFRCKDLTLQFAYHGALAVDFMPYAGKWSKQVFNTQCVCYSTRSVCLSVCLSTSY